MTQVLSLVEKEGMKERERTGKKALAMSAVDFGGNRWGEKQILVMVVIKAVEMHL